MLPEKVLLVIVAAAAVIDAAAAAPAPLFEKVLLVTVKRTTIIEDSAAVGGGAVSRKGAVSDGERAKLSMPPPFMLPGAVLFMIVQLETESVPLFTIAPPEPPPLPFSTVRYFKVRVAPAFTTST